MHRSALRRSNDNIKVFITAIMGIALGFFLGMSLPSSNVAKVHIPSSFGQSFNVPMADIEKFLADINSSQAVTDKTSGTEGLEYLGSMKLPKIYVPTNPLGAESLPPGIVVSESDFHLRRLWGEPSEDLPKKPKYLLTFTVGYDQRYNIDASVKKFSDHFAILLFHYDNRTSEWDEFEWSKKAIHVSAWKQTKWWYAKRFLHPDIVSAYEYIFIWDEDLGVEHFDGDKFIELVKKHGLAISQPALGNSDSTWEMTKRRDDRTVHKTTKEKPGWCSDPYLPPCAAFVEIMAPVFSREAWRCVWHMIQNDLVHGWGLDFALRRCVEPAHEKIGVVDSQWIIHQGIPSLKSQGAYLLVLEIISVLEEEFKLVKFYSDGDADDHGKQLGEAVRERCRNEWAQFQTRLTEADKVFFEEIRN